MRLFVTLAISVALALACSKQPGPPAPGPAPAPAPAPETGATLSGTIAIAPSLAGGLAPTDVLFIIARRSEQGPPLAVRKVANPSFPLRYTLSAQDVIFPGAPFTGEVLVQVRVDKDGDPISKTPGDLRGVFASNPATVGASNVDILINERLEPAPPPAPPPGAPPASE